MDYNIMGTKNGVEGLDTPWRREMSIFKARGPGGSPREGGKGPLQSRSRAKLGT